MGTWDELAENPYKKTFSCGTEPYPEEVSLVWKKKLGRMRLVG